MSSEATAGNDLSSASEKEQFYVVGIGASAGGVQALQQFFEHVEPDSGAAYVVILHLSPDHDSQLAAILQLVTKMPVDQVTATTTIAPNQVYVIPPNQHLSMQDGEIVVSPNLQLEDRRAPVDIFFRTLASSHRTHAICVVLSGTGANGSMGLKHVKEKGGAAFVQNPREADFSEMPRNSIATGLVDEILPVASIPSKIAAYINLQGQLKIAEEPALKEEAEHIALREIFTLLRQRTGHDFSNYKRATLLRRIERRIKIRLLPNLPAYAAFMREHPEETASLLKDILISVTNFFRDQKVFASFEKENLPKILAGKRSADEVRIWVAGCATGEEAYTLAMLLAEQTQGIIDAPKIQIFATDIDEAAINTARDGLYTINDAADISAERLQRFFNKEGDLFRVRREIRETVLFAYHNFIKDPPFSRLDLVSCRNVLIYLNHSAQERVLETFHFALKPGAILMLGSSESVDGAGHLYAPLNKEMHIFQARPVTSRVYPVPESIPSFNIQKPALLSGKQETEHGTGNRFTIIDLHQRLLEQYAPPSIVVNEEYDIIHTSEKAVRFLQVAPGEPSQNLLKLINPDLRLDLRSALYQATQKKMPIEVRGLKITRDGGNTDSINLFVRPVLGHDNVARDYMLVIFETAETDTQPVHVTSSNEPVARHLEEELIRTKAQLRTAIEQHEFQAEELKASNEELQAMNEELRSAAEELETSKEELQSINEELSTVNQELKVKIEETTLAGNNLQNLMNSVDIGTIFLDRSFRVMFFTPAARQLFNLIPSDHGRPLTDITSQLDYTGLQEDVSGVLDKLHAIEREVRTKAGLSYVMRILPYRTAEDHINGVVLTFIDITRRVTSEQNLRLSEERLRSLNDTIPQLTWSADPKGNPDYFNHRFFEYSGLDNEAAFSKGWKQLIPPEDATAILQRWEKFIQAGATFEMELKLKQKDGFYRWHLLRKVPVFDDGGNLTGWSGSATDIDAIKTGEEAMVALKERYRIALASAEMGTWDWDMANESILWNDQHLILFGMLPGDDQVIGVEQFLQLIHRSDVEEVRKKLQKAVTAVGVFHAEFRIILPRDQTRWVSGYGRALGSGGGPATRMVGVTYDITERKKLEKEKEEFINTASHEIKTPLTSLKAYTELMQELFADSGQLQYAGYMQKMNAQVNRLNGLVTDLLDTTKIAEGQLPLLLQQFNLHQLIKELVDDASFVSPAHQISFTSTGDCIVTADKDRIWQVISNLITNATKYSPQGGAITVTCASDLNNVRVSVTDQGIGIPEELQSRIFDRFFRVSNSASNPASGMGLGLFISAGIVRRHGGNIGVTSSKGKGSTFFFTLPLTIIAQPAL